jgi:integrase
MKNKGNAQTTIDTVNKNLKLIAKHTNINDPNAVLDFIVNHQCSNTYKHLLTEAYSKYAQYNKIQWQPPHFRPEEHAIKVPTNEKIQMIIANSGKRMAIKLMISAEGLRPIEVCNLKVKDIDIEQRLMYPTTAKHGSPRTLKIKPNLATAIQEHIIRNNLKPEDKLFNITPKTYGKEYSQTRNKLADKLHDPTIRQIRLYDFRHFYATRLYAKTHEILIVMNQLGHKNIKNTMIYTHLINVENDEYTTKTVQLGTPTTIKEITQLSDDGFEYYTEADGFKLFRKRK